MKLPSLAILSAANSVHTHRWVNALTQYFDVSLFSLNTHQDSMNAISTKVQVHYLPSSGKLAYFTAHRTMKRLIKNQKFDVYNGHYASGYGTILRLSDKHPAVLNFWGSDIFEFPNTSRLNKWLIKKNINSADVIVSTSNIMAQEIKRVFPHIVKDILVVPFGVDLIKFSFRKRQINKDHYRIGTCKILSPTYAIDDLIRAFAKSLVVLESNGKSATLELYGDGPSRGELEQLVKDLELEEKVNFHGWISHTDIPQALENLDLFVLTSVTESFGVSAIEAMAAGVPVIATRTPGFLEVIVEGVTGLFVDVHDSDTMALEIIRVLGDPGLYQSLAMAGRKHVEKNYNWEQNVKQFADILRLTSDGLI